MARLVTTVIGLILVAVLAACGGTPPPTVDCTDPTELSADVTVDTVLPLACYLVTRNIEVSAAMTLLPGTVLQFQTSSGLRVAGFGSLRAEGSAVNPITFTSASGNPNDWRGVGIFSNSAANALDHVIIENAGITWTTINGGNATNLYLGQFGRAAITNSTFRRAGNAGVGLYVEDQTGQLTAFFENTFDANTGAAMRVAAQQLGMIGPGNTFGMNALAGAAHIRVASAADITASARWRAADVPYRFAGNHVLVDPGAVITIEAGARLEFESSAGMRVNAGALRALGASDAPVTFTSASGNPDGWRGLGIASSSELNELRFVAMANAGATWSVINDGNSTNLYLGPDARVSITDSTFASSGGHGIVLGGERARLGEFERNAFDGNASSPLRLYGNQLTMIGEDNVFRPNAPFGSRFVEVLGATVQSDQLWRALDVPYRFVENVFVNDPDATVTVAAGATLEFTNAAGLRVNAGALQAVGTADAGITFTSSTGNPGGWRGLGIASGGANRLRFVTMEHAGVSWSAINDSRPANLYVAPGGVVSVADSVFRNSSSPHDVYVEGRLNDEGGNLFGTVGP